MLRKLLLKLKRSGKKVEKPLPGDSDIIVKVAVPSTPDVKPRQPSDKVKYF